MRVARLATSHLASADNPRRDPDRPAGFIADCLIESSKCQYRLTAGPVSWRAVMEAAIANMTSEVTALQYRQPEAGRGGPCIAPVALFDRLSG